MKSKSELEKFLEMLPKNPDVNYNYTLFKLKIRGKKPLKKKRNRCKKYRDN